MAIDPAYVTLLTPVVGGAVTAIGLYVKEWQVARGKAATRETAVADANAEVAFATEWWNASQLMGSAAPPDCPQRMAAFLADAESLVARTQHLAEARRNPVTFTRVLLLYPMHRRSARILKWLFFAALFFVFSTAFVLASDMASSKTADSQAVSGDVVVLISMMVLLLVLRLAATGLEHEVPAAPAPMPRGTPGASAASPPASFGPEVDATPDALVDLTRVEATEAAPNPPSSTRTS